MLEDTCMGFDVSTRLEKLWKLLILAYYSYIFSYTGARLTTKLQSIASFSTCRYNIII